MIRIRSNLPDLERVPLGRTLSFHIENDEPVIGTRLFLRQAGIFYLEPLRGWSRQPTDDIEVRVEAPGRYVFAVQWHAGNGEGGWCEQPFQAVSTGRPKNDAPMRVRLEGDVRLWAPTRWDALHLRSAEDALWSAMPDLVQPGTAVYDIGANIGAYTLRMAGLVGSAGRVYAIEANPLCVHYLRLNLANSGRTNVDILPMAMLDHDGETRFAVDYGNTNLGTTKRPTKPTGSRGHVISVGCLRFDQLRSQFALRRPRLVKIDVEGVEARVVAGMAESLALWRPTLVLELHGVVAARETLAHLDLLGYRYFGPGGVPDFSDSEAVTSHHGDTVFQLVATVPDSLATASVVG